ncbi:MAG: alpha/beta hydrolase [Candidatus Dormibacteraeota bacterium]|nr:alpha/beta hydrolase [Candidatus Dormibacteraeota bacterium]
MNKTIVRPANLSSLRPRIAETAAGPVEFDLSDGGGPVVLASHGGLGGVDQARVMLDWLGRDRYRLLSVSRPGYLGTPLSSGTGPERQADLFAALLDHLGIPNVVVIGLSAGGPAAYLLAARHADRVKAMVAIDSVSGRQDPAGGAGRVTETIFMSSLSEALIGLVTRRAPARLLRQALSGTASISPQELRAQMGFVLSSPEQLAFFKAFMATVSPYRPRKPGTDNDTAQGLAIRSLPLEGIRCPVLVVHGTHDTDVPLFHGVDARERIAGAEHIWIDRGSHFGFWLGPHAAAAQSLARSFISRQISGCATSLAGRRRAFPTGG